MQHLIFILPALGIIVFFMFPPVVSIPLYIFILILSALIYWVLVRTMRKRPESGRENLVGSEARVISKLSPSDAAQYMVKVRGELWSASSTEPLQAGDSVKITAVDGIMLIVKKTTATQPQTP